MEASAMHVFHRSVSYHYSDWSRAEASIWMLLREQTC